MSDGQTEQPESEKEERQRLQGDWANRVGAILPAAVELVRRCREVSGQLQCIRPTVFGYRARMRRWQAVAATVHDLEMKASSTSDGLIQLQAEWDTLPRTMGNVLATQNSLALLRESRSEMMAEIASLKSELTNVQQALIGNLANFLAWVSISLGVLSVVLALVVFL